ncbi:MAG: isoprenylcysteine carboxylmethyltransferase family protein [Desulfurococcales archaeon]|nr:isoprenylcysteine carboxylmethyltransferase family protein [Desulfurococcales archaeon]
MRQAWKFAYWPLIWTITLAPPLVFDWGPRLHGLSGLFLQALGLVVIVYSLLLTSIAGRTLRLYGHTGDSFWPDKLVDVGIYSCMRHPQHLGLALFPLGLSLATAMPVVLLASGWSVAGALAFVLLVEEPECLVKYGDKYVAYMRRVPPFSLNPRCLMEALRLLEKSDNIVEVAQKPLIKDC